MKLWCRQHPLIAATLVLWFFFLIALLCFTAEKMISFCQQEATYYTTLKKIKIHSGDKKLLSKKTRQALEAALQQEKISQQELLTFFQHYQIVVPPELVRASPSFFQDHLQHDVSKIQEQASLANVTLPARFFLGLEQFKNLPPKSIELFNIVPLEIALRWIAQKITEHEGLSLQQFRIEPLFQTNNNSISSLGCLTLSFTSDEQSFQKLVNEITQAPYFFIIKNIVVENSHKNPPSRLVEEPDLKGSSKLASEPSIHIILGREKVIVTMIIDILKVTPSEKNEATCLNKEFFQPREKADSSTSATTWNPPIGSAQLFIARNYFVKNGQVIDLLEEKNPLHPPVPNQWLIDNNLDYSDPNILSEDPDHDGFTNLEEWLGSSLLEAPGSNSSNPNDPISHPLLWTKLRCSQNDIQKNNFRLEFTGYEKENGETIFQLQPLTPLPCLNEQGKSFLSTKTRYLKLGEKLEGSPLRLSSFEEKQSLHHEVSYDTSELTLLNETTGEHWKLIKKSSLHPDATTISILEGVHFHYVLPVKPLVISVNCGDYFSLESLPLPKENQHAGEKILETYQLLNINKEFIEIQKEGAHYLIPISPLTL